MSFEILFVCLWNFVVGPKVSGGGCAPRSAVHVHVHVLVLAGGASHAPPLGCRSPCRPDRGLGRSSGGAPSRARTPVLREVPRPREVHHETEVHHRLALLPRNRLMVRRLDRAGLIVRQRVCNQVQDQVEVLADLAPGTHRRPKDPPVFFSFLDIEIGKLVFFSFLDIEIGKKTKGK